MITCTIIKKKGAYLGYEIKGHANYAEHGKDIVCSAVSTISQAIRDALSDILRVEIQTNQRDGYLLVALHSAMSREQFEQTQLLLKTLELTMQNIASEYPKHVEVKHL